VLFYCTYALYELFSWGCFCPFVFVGAKMGIDLYSTKWREKTWKKSGKADDARNAEISQTFKNIKTLKLYAWTNIFEERVIQRREKQEALIRLGEFKNVLNGYIHRSIGGVMKPAVITVGYLSGATITASGIFYGNWCMDWLNWPLHMLPHFMRNVGDTRRSMTKIQKCHMLAEV